MGLVYSLDSSELLLSSPLPSSSSGRLLTLTAGGGGCSAGVLLALGGFRTMAIVLLGLGFLSFIDGNIKLAAKPLNANGFNIKK
jgi:hypothetical protein